MLMRSFPTAALWIVSLANLLVAGVIAAEFVFMATSLDPGQILTAGVQPWSDAAVAAASFAALAVVTAISLGLWRTARFKSAAVLLTAAEVGCVAWVCVKVYNEYF